MFAHYIPLVLTLTVASIASIAVRKLTPLAGATGWIVGFLVFQGAGYTGIAMLAAFFIAGTLATSWKWEEKEQKQLEERNKGRRTAGQVLANGGVAAFLGLTGWVYPALKEIMPVLIAASLSAAAADTLSSELGMVYGRNFYTITNFKKGKRGLDGVVSMEGTLFGVAGSALIALVYGFGFGHTLTTLVAIILSGTVGNLADSILGATLERRGRLGNNAVNALNTLSAVITMLICISV